MLLMNFFQAKYIGLALLPMISILQSGQVALAEGREVNCKAQFDSDASKTDVGCWPDSQTKFTCPQTSCRSTRFPDQRFGQMVFLHCMNEKVMSFDVTVHPRTYYHYPKGDGKWYFGRNGFVAAFDTKTKLWYNCLYDGRKDNQDTYTCSDCKEA
ncbi:hypothetical protein PGT21_002094 [Puccinia graminis f. sp. tritici]|uniref:Secreted protein n=1 Tax=Puccinia graminis f. sp. tritici TaxID=56615 RepID=A0A5B0LSM9_PUCGR|nr:hypothetical protein PGT21_002094 [Puccinia graminis f. sp. tritici]KAA1137868.1 hypothetical protein PGTUg99_027022 [Puccinia graminis f. sp. tritici]